MCPITTIHVTKRRQQGNVLTFSKPGVALADDGLQWTRKSINVETITKPTNERLINSNLLIRWVFICLFVHLHLDHPKTTPWQPPSDCDRLPAIIRFVFQMCFSPGHKVLFWTSLSTIWMFPPFQLFTHLLLTVIYFLHGKYMFYFWHNWHLFRNFTQHQQLYHSSNHLSYYIIITT